MIVNLLLNYFFNIDILLDIIPEYIILYIYVESILRESASLVREPNPEFLQKSILPYTVSPLDFLDFFHLSVS